MRDKFKIIRQSRTDLRALTTSAQFGEAKARAIADSGARAMADIAVLKAKGDSEIYALLTPEQKAQAAKAKADWEARRNARGQGGPGQRGPGGQRGMGAPTAPAAK